ncbi:MAG: hypothetical protein ACK4YP_05215, partial [Myxococcota bacterium]
RRSPLETPMTAWLLFATLGFAGGGAVGVGVGLGRGVRGVRAGRAGAGARTSTVGWLRCTP